MNFDIRKIDQSKKIIDEKLFYPMYNNLHKASQNNFQIRYIAPLVGAADGLISLAQAVAIIGETTIKGTINIFGSFVFDSCSFKRGALQIIFAAPAIGLGSILIIPISIITITLRFFVNPEQLCVNERDLISSKIKNIPLKQPELT